MFPIGTARDLDRLRKLAELSVRVEGQAEPIVVRDYQPWFARLPDALPAARDRVSLTWDAGYADRVYLQDIGTAFPRIGASGSRDYGRLRTHRAGPQPPAATDDEPHRLSEVRAGVVLLQGEIEVPDPQPDLTFALYDTYEATVRPFRRLPATEGTPCLQQLTPAPHDARRWPPTRVC